MNRYCFDIDNVIASTDEVMRGLIADFTQRRVRLSYEDIVKFDYHQCVDSDGAGITKDEWNEIHALFSEPSNLLRVKPLPGAIDGLRELAKHGCIALVTARLPRARQTTVQWLEKHGVPDHDLHFVRHFEKHVSLRGFSAVIEDDYDQAVAFAMPDETRCYLMRHPWNASMPRVPGIHWVDGWSELVERIRGDGG